MAQVLIRNLDPKHVARLKERARQHGRSLEAELRRILERAASADPAEARTLAARIRRRLAGRNHSDSAALVAEDRSR
jgi:antitoxin FitA